MSILKPTTQPKSRNSDSIFSDANFFSFDVFIYGPRALAGMLRQIPASS